MVLKIAFFILVVSTYSCSTEPKVIGTTQQDIEPIDGAQLFLNNCASCHGVNGKLGMSGAKNLSKIILNDKQIARVIMNGKGTMPAFKEILSSDTEIQAVVKHVRTLKTKK